MFSISGWSSRLDVWLREHLGRPYELALSIGLGLAIVETIKGLGDTVRASHALQPLDVGKMVVVVLFQAALLINQLAQLNERREARRQRRAARRGAAKS